MGERSEACAIGDEGNFARLSAGARPFSRSEEATFFGDLRLARDIEADLRDREGAEDLELRRASLEKWRLLHDWTRRHPYRDRPHMLRSDVWREALERFRPLRDSELIDWLALQIEVAANLENGVPDMRPRDPGPTWIVTLEYVANRKRKALAVLHWAEAAKSDGCYTVDSDWHARSAAILGGEPTLAERGDGGHEGAPFIVEDKS
jgi:hypothetical protein